jgi:catechol 2,3-dioxygenase-like lactoylglutathione lyase family enzyme
MFLEVISVPISDQDRAIKFYRDKLGFKVIRDNPFDEDRRWVEVSPSPDAQTTISLVTWFEQMPPGSAQGLVLKVEDIEKIRAELIKRDVRVEPIFDTPWGRFANFTDPDGNGWSLRQEN